MISEICGKAEFNSRNESVPEQVQEEEEWCPVRPRSEVCAGLVKLIPKLCNPSKEKQIFYISHVHLYRIYNRCNI